MHPYGALVRYVFVIIQIFVLLVPHCVSFCNEIYNTFSCSSYLYVHLSHPCPNFNLISHIVCMYIIGSLCNILQGFTFNYGQILWKRMQESMSCKCLTCPWGKEGQCTAKSYLWRSCTLISWWCWCSNWPSQTQSSFTRTACSTTCCHKTEPSPFMKFCCAPNYHQLYCSCRYSPIP